MSLFSLLSIARDGILASQGAMNVTGQNVAGASTPGYVRRTPLLEGSLAGGVQMSGTVRSFDRFTYGQLVDQESHLASAKARAGAVSYVEALVSPADNTLADRASSLFDAFHDLALHPSDLAVRSSVLSRAEFLARGFSETADGLERFRGELFSQARDVATEVNDRLERLKTLELNIHAAEAQGQDSSALRDARDQLAREVGERVGGRVIESASGDITLFGMGTVLYGGQVASKLDVAVNTNGNLVVSSTRAGTTSDVTAHVDSGTLGGLLEARDSDVPRTLAGLDAFATDISNALNSLHAGGFGLDGSTGRNLFTTPPTGGGAAHAMSLDPSLDGHPELLAASGTVADLPGGNSVATQLANASSMVLGGTGTASERYGELANTVGVTRTSADAEQQMREDTVATASALRESASGVSTDEEMIRLQQFQRGFEAASKVLATVNTLFDSLMQAI